MFSWSHAVSHIVKKCVLVWVNVNLCHVNVTGDWKVVELGHLLRAAVCQMGTVVSLCVRACDCTTACIHLRCHVHTVQACLCMGACS